MAGSVGRLTEQQIREILLSDDRTSVLAERYGVSTWTIRMIFLGMRYAHMAPDLERRNPVERARTCWSCKHCIGHSNHSEPPKGCKLAIPEQALMGPRAGGLCNWHQPEGQEPAFLRETSDDMEMAA